MKQSAAILTLTMGLWVNGVVPSDATTIRSVSVDEMLERSELIFVGRVSGTKVRAGQNPATIRTCANFAIIEIWKGPALTGPLELCFAGGSRGSTRRQIHRMIYPVLGETGIYFVASLSDNLVHPLYGWNQGYLRIPQVAGAPAGVHTVDGDAVVDVESRPDPTPAALSTGVARGMKTRRSRSDALPPLSPAAFKEKLRQILKNRP